MNLSNFPLRKSLSLTVGMVDDLHCANSRRLDLRPLHYRRCTLVHQNAQLMAFLDISLFWANLDLEQTIFFRFILQV